MQTRYELTGDDQRKLGPNTVLAGSVVVALIVHAVLFAFFYSYSIGPKAFIADDSTYRVSISNRIVDPSPESVIEPLKNKEDDPVLDKVVATSTPEPIAKPVEEPIKEEVVEAPQTPKEKPIDKIEEQAVEKVVAKAPSRNKVASDTLEKTKVEESDEEVASEASAETLPKQTPKEEVAEVKAPTQKVEEPKEQFRSPSYELGSPTNPRPPYPSLARRRGWEGDVLLGVYVDAEGEVTYVEILKSSNVSALDFAAYSTIYESWSFTAADAHEMSLRGYVKVPISFRLN